jgi:maltose alpha-D-glucosyltransferase/alpha-amylase
VPKAALVELIDMDPPPLVAETMGAYLETARLLGRRTAELHLALGIERGDPAFAPEAFTSLYQRSLYQSMRNLTTRVFRLLRDQLPRLSERAAVEARSVAGLEERILDTFKALLTRRIQATRIRCHGDYHLGQVLHTGRDFVIVDFEGEPARSLAERRLKASPLRDVAGMLRSFAYAAHTGLLNTTNGGVVRPEDAPVLEPWAEFWRLWTSSAFLRSYLHRAADASFVPRERAELEALLSVLLLEKAVYELGYELNNRPDWLGIPIRGILQVLDAS